MTDGAQDFAYGAQAAEIPGYGAGSGGPALSIFADRSRIRSVLREDAQAAGLSVRAVRSLADLAAMAGVNGTALPGSDLGDIVLIDCPVIENSTLAALCELDQRAMRAGRRLIVSTSVDGLEAVFSCMDQSSPVLLVDPTRADRVLALGRTMAELPGASVRELSDDDRLMLLKLSEQVGLIAGRIESLAPEGRPIDGDAQASARSAFGFDGNAPGGAVPVAAPVVSEGALPDAKLVRRILRQRQLRSRYIDGELFADPAWDMLLDLTAAHGEGKRVSVTSLCIASGVPPTTALRWIGQMVESGLFQRHCDENDRRRAFIELTDKAIADISRYFAETGLGEPLPI